MTDDTSLAAVRDRFVAEATRPATTAEKIVNRMIERHWLRRVEISTRDGAEFACIAYPLHHHPMVAERRAAALAGQGSLSVAEATGIVNRAADEALAVGRGATIADALSSLAAALGTPPRRRRHATGERP